MTDINNAKAIHQQGIALDIGLDMDTATAHDISLATPVTAPVPDASNLDAPSIHDPPTPPIKDAPLTCAQKAKSTTTTALLDITTQQETSPVDLPQAATLLEFTTPLTNSPVILEPSAALSLSNPASPDADNHSQPASPPKSGDRDAKEHTSSAGDTATAAPQPFAQWPHLQQFWCHPQPAATGGWHMPSIGFPFLVAPENACMMQAHSAVPIPAPVLQPMLAIVAAAASHMLPMPGPVMHSAYHSYLAAYHLACQQHQDMPPFTHPLVTASLAGHSDGGGTAETPDTSSGGHHSCGGSTHTHMHTHPSSSAGHIDDACTLSDSHNGQVSQTAALPDQSQGGGFQRLPHPFADQHTQDGVAVTIAEAAARVTADHCSTSLTLRQSKRHSHGGSTSTQEEAHLSCGGCSTTTASIDLLLPNMCPSPSSSHGGSGMPQASPSSSAGGSRATHSSLVSSIGGSNATTRVTPTSSIAGSGATRTSRITYQSQASGSSGRISWASGSSRLGMTCYPDQSVPHQFHPECVPGQWMGVGTWNTPTLVPHPYPMMHAQVTSPAGSLMQSPRSSALAAHTPSKSLIQQAIPANHVVIKPKAQQLQGPYAIRDH